MNRFAPTHAVLDSDEGNESAPDLHVLLVRGIARSFPWVIALTVLGAAIGLLIGLLEPNTFVSETKLLLRVGAREQITSESMVGLGGEREQRTVPTLQDELHMLSDVAIFERVARSIGPGEILQPADPTRLDGPDTSAPIRAMHSLQARFLPSKAPAHTCTPEDCSTCLRAATKLLVENTVTANDPGSNVIQITHESTSPEKAQLIAKALSNEFIERHRQEFSIKALVERNRIKVEEAKQARDAAAQAYVEHVNAAGFVDLDLRVPALLTEIGALETELFAAQVRREGIARQRTALAQILENTPTETETAPAPVIPIVPSEEYETQLTLKRNLLVQKQNLLLENRPIEEARKRAKLVDDQIAEVEARLQQIPQAVVQGTARGEGVTFAALLTRVQDLDLEEEALAVKLDLLQQRLSEKQALVTSLRKEELVSTLARKDLAAVRDAEENRYELLLGRFSMLEALGEIDLNEDANLRVLQAPTLDLEKVGPERFSLLMKGLLAGLFAGCVFAVLRQRFDTKLRYPESFERTHGIPVLGVVPHLPSLRRLPRRAEGVRS